MLLVRGDRQSSTDADEVTLEAAFRKNMGSVNDTPAGSRSVRFSDAKFFSRRDACAAGKDPAEGRARHQTIPSLAALPPPSMQQPHRGRR